MYSIATNRIFNKIQLFLIGLSLFLVPMDAWLILPIEGFIVKISVPRLLTIISFFIFLSVYILNKKLPRIPLYWLIAIWTFWCILSIFWAHHTIDKDLIIRKAFSMLFANVIVILSVYVEKNEKLQNIFKLIIISSLISALLEQFFGLRPYVERQHSFIFELTAFYFNPAHLGATLALFSIFLIGSKQKKNFYNYILFLLSTYVIIRTGSKGALIGLLIGIIFLFLNVSNIAKGKIFIYTLSGVLLFFFAFKTNLVPNSIIEKINIFSYSPLVYGSYIERKLIYKEMIKYILQSPLIGYGLGSTSSLIWTSSHNLFLELWIEGGIINLFLFLALFLFLLINLGKKKDDKCRYFFSALIAFIPISLTISSVFSFWSFWMILGGSIYQVYKERNKDQILGKNKVILSF